MRSPEARPVTMIDPEVGGGHPTFLLAQEEALQNRGFETQQLSAREVANDMVSRLYWNGTQLVYRIGGMGGPLTWAYEEFREWQAQHGGGLPRIVKDRLREALPNNEGTIIISTHALTAVKPEGAKLVLLQGDNFGGKGYAVENADLIAVPEDSSRDELIAYGIPPEKIAVVGFFVPAGIQDSLLLPVRMGQLNRGEALHLGIYFTGALPRPHVSFVYHELIPKLSERMKKDGSLKITVYTFTNDFVGEEFLRLGRELRLRTSRNDDDQADESWNLRVIYAKTVREAILRSIAAASDPKMPISVLVTMLGERYSWTKFFAVFPLPPINRKNAGQNTRVAIQRGVVPLPSTTENLVLVLQGDLKNLKDRMEKAQTIPTNGAENTAGIIANFTHR